MSDEPAGYLGGAQAPESEDDPYALPPAEDDPYATPQGEEVVGFLGGEAPPEELPALPPQEAAGANYSVSDFIEGDEGAGAYGDPYADPHDPYATATEEFQDPYALPPEAPAAYDEYEGYDTDAMAQADPAYFDSMGAADDEYAGAATAPAADYDQAYDDDDSPKTISQQDAESIIRRITTKRILPPEAEGTAAPAPARLTTANQGGLRVWPILVVFLILAGGGVYVFRQQIAERYPALAGYLGVELKKEVVEEKITEVPLEERLKKAMLDKALKSELKAFGATKDDLKPQPPVNATAPQGTEKR